MGEACFHDTALPNCATTLSKPCRRDIGGLARAAVVVAGGDGLHDLRVVELLRLVPLIAAGVAGGVKVADVLDILADRADEVAFLNLDAIGCAEKYLPHISRFRC